MIACTALPCQIGHLRAQLDELQQDLADSRKALAQVAQPCTHSFTYLPISMARVRKRARVWTVFCSNSAGSPTDSKGMRVTVLRVCHRVLLGSGYERLMVPSSLLPHRRSKSAAWRRARPTRCAARSLAPSTNSPRSAAIRLPEGGPSPRCFLFPNVPRPLPPSSPGPYEDVEEYEGRAVLVRDCDFSPLSPSLDYVRRHARASSTRRPRRRSAASMRSLASLALTASGDHPIIGAGPVLHGATERTCCGPL